MKALFSVLAVAAVLVFVVWQEWGPEAGEPKDASRKGGAFADGERPLPALSTNTTIATMETSPGGASPAPAPSPSDAVERPADPPLGRAEFAREAAGGAVIPALKRASAALLAAPDGPEREAYLADVLPLSGRHFLSRHAGPEVSFEHVVASGDTLARLARTWKEEKGALLTAEFVMAVNGMTDPRRLSVGQRLRVVTARPSLHVDKARHRLDYLLDGVIVREFRVGLGRDNRTPEGSFVIASRLDSPVWFNEGESIPFGDSRNILGTRWLGFENRDDLFGFGIHGTNDETTIGKDVSNGCVRMRNRDVEALFDLVPIGTPVTIVP